MSVGPLGANSGEIRITISPQKTSFCVHHSNVWHKLKFERAPNISYLALQISYGMFVVNISEWRSGWGSNHTSGWLDWWRLGPVSIQRLPLPGIEVPMLEISRSWYSLIFNMGIPILADDIFILGWPPDPFLFSNRKRLLKTLFKFTWYNKNR